MQYIVKKISVIEESNDMGTLFLERLIEKMLLQELGLSVSHESIILFNQNKFKDEDVNHGD